MSIDPADPLALLPPEFPPHPRVLTTPAKLASVRRQLRTVPWASVAIERLREAADGLEIPAQVATDEADAKQNGALAWHAMHAAIAGHLLDEPAYFPRATAALRWLADGYAKWPMTTPHHRAVQGGMGEDNFAGNLAIIYDLLAAHGLSAEDDAVFRRLLLSTTATLDQSPHHDCGNHNTCSLRARVHVACALGDRHLLTEALYGYERDGSRRYGVVHQLAHDFLADGMWFERTSGYHLLMLHFMGDIADCMANNGLDLWHTPIPAQLTAEPLDRHAAYGPHGTRSLRSAFELLPYLAFPTLDMPLIYDSGLTELTAISDAWGQTLDFACAVYDDPRLHGLRAQIDASRPPESRRYPGLPLGLQGQQFFRHLASWPELSATGAIDWQADCMIGQTGRHEAGCTILPTTGWAILRSGRAGASLVWGPHVAGHMSPAALHLDLHDGLGTLAVAPTSGGYDDPTHLTWMRTTIAHNTVTIDRTPMIPYHIPTESIWEAERFHGKPTGGELLAVQHTGERHAIRIANEAVYPGTRLDRSVVMDAHFVLDVFRVTSDTARDIDWAMHLLGSPEDNPGSPADLGDGRGYQHLHELRRLSAAGAQRLSWTAAGRRRQALILVPAGAALHLARTTPEHGHYIGTPPSESERFTAIVRSHGASALFISVWSLTDASPPAITHSAGDAATDVTLSIDGSTWRFPAAPTDVVYHAE